MLGRESGAPRIVRPARSGVRAALIVAGVLLGVFALYVVYELGRYNAGYDRQAVAQQRTELEVRIEHLERANRELRTRLAESDTVGAGRAREQAETARTIGDLQAQVARQSQELAFYRGVVAQGAASLGVKIEQLRITAGRQRELRYNFRYLQTFDQQLTVPPTFKPERLNVEVSSGRRDVAPLSQTFVWSVEASP